MIDLLAPAHAGDNDVLLGLPVGGNNPADRLADHRLGGVPEQPLGRPVPGRNDAVEILPDDRVVARLEDCGKARRWQVREIRHSPPSYQRSNGRAGYRDAGDSFATASVPDRMSSVPRTAT